jgi:hypothetical protein
LALLGATVALSPLALQLNRQLPSLMMMIQIYAYNDRQTVKVALHVVFGQLPTHIVEHMWLTSLLHTLTSPLRAFFGPNGPYNVGLF